MCIMVEKNSSVGYLCCLLLTQEELSHAVVHRRKPSGSLPGFPGILHLFLLFVLIENRGERVLDAGTSDVQTAT